MAKPPFPWIGGKEKIAPYILQTFPAKLAQYVEPFGGSGAVLLALPQDQAAWTSTCGCPIPPSSPTSATRLKEYEKGIRPVSRQPESGGLHPAGNTGADAPPLFHPRPSVHLQRRQRGQEILHG